MSTDDIVKLVKKMPQRQRDRLVRRLQALPRGSRSKSKATTEAQRERAWNRFFEICGMVKGGPSDVSENKHRYVAEGVSLAASI